LNDPNLKFNDQYVVLDDGSVEVVYYASPGTLIISPPEKELNISNPEVTFTLTNTTLSKLLRLAGMNTLPNLSIIGAEGKMIAKIHDKQIRDGNKASMMLGDWTGEDFTATFSTENLKLLPDDYNVELKLGTFAKFVGSSRKIVYYISLDKK
jgi:hypothetical protein